MMTKSSFDTFSSPSRFCVRPCLSFECDSGAMEPTSGREVGLDITA